MKLQTWNVKEGLWGLWTPKCSDDNFFWGGKISQFSLKLGLQKLVGNVWDLVLSEIMIPTVVAPLLCSVICDYMILFFGSMNTVWKSTKNSSWFYYE